MDYTVKINDFDGPLDLLLHLIKEANISIWDIKICDITVQYLDYINHMKKLDLNIASEYLVMASELMEMKSRSLLPKKEEEMEEEEDTRELLIQRLINYSRYKEVTAAFKDLEEERRQIHTKEPSVFFQNKEDSLDDNIDLSDLLLAFQQLLDRKEKEKPLQTKVTSKEYSVQERNIQIKQILQSKKKISFYDLFDFYNKDYVVVTFLSILDLAKKKELVMKQDQNFGEIYLMCEEV